MLFSAMYSILLRLYPASFRAQFGAEMAQVFKRAIEERRHRGHLVCAAFALKELLGLMAGAAMEWPSQLRRSANRDDDLPFPTDRIAAEKYIDLVSQRLIHAIANHQFAKARFYDRQERSARELLVRLRLQSE